MAVATLIGGSGERIAGGMITMAGAATAGGETVGITAGVGTVVEQVMVAIATFAGGIIVPTIIADGTDGTVTVGGTIDGTIDARAVIGHGTLAGAGTSRFNNTEPSVQRRSLELTLVTADPNFANKSKL